MPQPQPPYKDLFEDWIKNRGPANGLKVLNQDGPRPVIRIYDVIGWPWIEAVDIAEQLDGIDADEIEVQIASPGGSVYEAIAIFNALRTHKAKIITRVDSMAASAASLIAQAGDERTMLTGSQMMIHDPWTITIGNYSQLRKVADILEKESGILAELYAERSGRPISEFVEMMQEETWFTAAETVDAGLADQVVKPSRSDTDEETQANATRFVEQTEAVVTDFEQLVARAEEVIAFRTEQGKPPLSEDSVELFEKLEAAHDRLTAAMTAPETGTETLNDVLETEYLRFVDITQGV